MPARRGRETTRPGPPDLERDGPYPWDHVRALHGGRRGIRRHPDGRVSLLLDYGLSGYGNFWDGEDLHYLGHGLVGDQVMTPPTAVLLDALHDGVPAHVWERLSPGEWYDLGPFAVIGVERREREGRQVFDFVLRRANGR